VIGIGNPAYAGLTSNNAWNPGLPVNTSLRADIYGVPGFPGLTGVAFIRNYFRGTAQVVVYLYGNFPNVVNGISLTTYGDLSAITAGGAQSIGTIFNPKNVTHGLPTDPIRMVGDLGNGYSNGNGAMNINSAFLGVTVVGTNNMIGRSIAIKANPDLGAAYQPDGNAGDVLAVGVFGISATPWAFGDPNFPDPPLYRNPGGVAAGIILPILFLFTLVGLGWYYSKKSQFDPTLVNVVDKDRPESDGGGTDDEEQERKKKRTKNKKRKKVEMMILMNKKHSKEKCKIHVNFIICFVRLTLRNSCR